ncbi:hypothetical protein HID58_028944 [Brassica napus]|uniref:Uncharacterized protein n=2 Tax=Brassica TaxID=3705 RepID=A0A3P6BB77_BRACM|nr:hypothetical protein HID58_028944 [Brassica napus]CAF2224546.1 unnamed protein product [Brassica napus]CAG7897259.1 unnamed protein product [Brassica rapa]VDD03347.1 unnamed protein product [Brassica rapa]
MGTKNARDKTNNNCAEINSRQHRMSSSSSAPPSELMGQSPPQTLVLPNLLSCLLLSCGPFPIYDWHGGCVTSRVL